MTYLYCVACIHPSDYFDKPTWSSKNNLFRPWFAFYRHHKQMIIMAFAGCDDDNDGNNVTTNDDDDDVSNGDDDFVNAFLATLLLFNKSLPSLFAFVSTTVCFGNVRDVFALLSHFHLPV